MATPIQNILDNLIAKLYHILPIKLRESIDEFGTSLIPQEYKIFLSHINLNKSLPDNSSRELTALLTLETVLDYIEHHETKEEAVVEMGNAIDEFTHFAGFYIDWRKFRKLGITCPSSYRSDVTYEKMCNWWGTVRQGHVKELYWKPRFITETRDSNGSIRSRMFVEDNELFSNACDEYKNYFNSIKTWDENGLPTYQKQYENYYPLLGEYVRQTYNQSYKGDIKYYESQFHANGKVSQIKTFHHDDLFSVRLFDNNGRETRYTHYKNGQLHGLDWIHGKNGRIKESREYINGKLHGTLTKYRKEFKIIKTSMDGGRQIEHYKILEEQYENGLLNGTRTEYYNENKPFKEEHYVNGVKSGSYTEWYENGQQAIEGRYLNDNKIGEWDEWYDNGDIKFSHHKWWFAVYFG